MQEADSQHLLVDTNQSFWQLASIQLTGVTSLPVLFTSIFLIQKASLLNSVIILVVANLILWVIRYGLISMSYQGRKSVMDLCSDYFGDIIFFKKTGIYSIAALLLISTMFLFVEETTIISKALTKTFAINEGPNIDPYMQISVIIGVASTIVCTWGIVALRWLSVICLPIILVAFITLIISSPSDINFLEHKAFSLAGLPLVLGINLAVTADLPTFFRHSRSWKSSVYALTMIQLFSLALGVGGLFLGAVIQPLSGSLSVNQIGFNGDIIKVAFIALVALSSICSNVSNIYGASVGWETFVRSPLVGKKEYLILGFLLTLIFLIITGLISLETPVDITGDSLVSLSFVFVIAYLIKSITKRSLGVFEKNIYFLAWLLSSLVILLQYAGFLLPEVPTLFVGLGVALLTIGFGNIARAIKQ